MPNTNHSAQVEIKSFTLAAKNHKVSFTAVTQYSICQQNVQLLGIIKITI